MISLPAATLPLLIGSSPSRHGPGGPLLRSQFDPATGTLITPTVSAPLRSSGFVALSPDGRHLYTTNEPAATVAAFALDRATGTLSPLGEASSGGRDPCHLAVSPDGRFLAVANYTGGSVALFTLRPDATIGERVLLHQPTGRGPHPQRQLAPHAHSVAFTRDGRWLLAADLGLDVVWLFERHADTYALAPAPLRLPPGAGPRQTAFSPDERSLHAVNELDSTLAVFDWPAGASASPRQILPLLPRDFAAPNTGAAVAVSPDGRAVYASNRGHDSIAIFTRDTATGLLTPRGHALLDARTPRHFALTPDGGWLVAAAQNSDRLVVFRIAPDGSLALSATLAGFPGATCVVPLPP